MIEFASKAFPLFEVPFVIWNNQELKVLPEDLTFDQVMRNDCVSGVPQLTNALVKTGRKFKVITGAEDNEKIIAEIKEYMKFIKVVKVPKTARIGVIGHVYPGMSTLTVRETNLLERIGSSLHYIEPAKIRSFHSTISSRLVDGRVNDLKRKHGISDLLR